MKQKIFTVYDDKAYAYLPPFFLPEKGMASRSFGECANSPDHQFGKHPADYTLFCIGEFDDQDAKVEIYPAKQSMGTALEFVRPSLVNGGTEQLEGNDG